MLLKDRVSFLFLILVLGWNLGKVVPLNNTAPAEQPGGGVVVAPPPPGGTVLGLPNTGGVVGVGPTIIVFPTDVIIEAAAVEARTTIERPAILVT